MEGKLRNMTAIYLLKGDRVLLLYRQGGKVVNNVWTGSAGGHFEKDELNDAKACVLRELKEELGVGQEGIDENLVSNEGVCKWFQLDEISTLEMPLTAKYVMEHYCKVGRFTDALYVGAACPGNMEFHELMES